MILATRWTAKGRTKEPQEEKKGVRALIDAGVETSTSIITHLTVRVCALGGIGGQGGGMISMKHSAMLALPTDAICTGFICIMSESGNSIDKSLALFMAVRILFTSGREMFKSIAQV